MTKGWYILSIDTVKTQKIDKLFFSAVKEEEWLNSMAAKGLVLESRKLSGYIFTASPDAAKYYYSVCQLPASNESEISRDIISKRINDGAVLLYAYANKAYFVTPLKNTDAFGGVLKDAESKRRHLKGTLAFNASLLAFWLGLLCYNLIYWVRFDSAGVIAEKKEGILWNYTIDMSAIFGDYPTTPYISLFIVLTVLCIPFTVYFLDQYLYSRRFVKTAFELWAKK